MPNDNPRGRYALHFHRCGVDKPISVVGVVVDGSPGWGLVNHSSNVDVSASVAVDCTGAGFVSEASDERGNWTNNLALNMLGYPGGHPSDLRNGPRVDLNDWASEGHGLWDQSPYTTRSGNIAAGCASVAFVRYPTDIATPPNKTVGTVTCAPDDGSTAYASLYGSYIYESNPDTPSQVTGLTVWGCQYQAFGLAYSGGAALSGFRFIGTSGAAVGLDNGRNIGFTSGYCVGFGTGLEPGAGGSLNTISDCYLRNDHADIIVKKTHNDYCAGLGTRVVTLTSNDCGPAGVVLDGTVAPLSPAPAWYCRYAPESLTLDGRQLYYHEQAPGQVLDAPLTTLNGLSNADALRHFGVAYAGAVTPTTATVLAGLSGGLCGPANSPGPGPLIPGAAYPHADGTLVDLMWADPDDGGKLIQETVRASDLKPGWMASFPKPAKDRVGFRLVAGP